MSEKNKRVDYRGSLISATDMSRKKLSVNQNRPIELSVKSDQFFVPGFCAIKLYVCSEKSKKNTLRIKVHYNM